MECWQLRPSYAPAGLCCGRNFRIRFSKSRSRGPDDPRFRDKARRWDSLSIYGYAVGGRLRSRVSFGYTRHLDAKGGGPSMWALASEPVAALGVVAPASLQGPQPYRVTRSRCCPRGSKPAHRGDSHLRDGKSARRSGFSRRIWRSAHELRSQRGLGPSAAAPDRIRTWLAFDPAAGATGPRMAAAETGGPGGAARAPGRAWEDRASF